MNVKLGLAVERAAAVRHRLATAMGCRPPPTLPPPLVDFREHSEHWLGRFDYQEAGPQLLLQAFLQRIVNGGGRIEREYGLGYGRTDLLIVWPFGAAGGAGGSAAEVTRTVIECKVLHRRHGLETTIAHGLEQTAGYMDRYGSRVGHLVIFDPSRDKSWDAPV